MQGAFNLRETLLSGQTFAFSREGEGYVGVVGGRPVFVKDAQGHLDLRCNDGDGAFWARYFDSDRDYAALLGRYPDDPYFAHCASAFPGLRVLRQPVWETICAFILSANNHQKRIEALYRGMSERLGEPVIWEGRTLYAFPSPERLAQVPESVLREIGVGYRAPYFLKTARAIADGFSLDLDAMEYGEALEHLTLLAGVGEKVADCVLLFSSRHSLAFPIDVWMERVLRERYGLLGNRKTIKRAAQDMFGAEAGIAQQYLFHGARTGILETFKKGDHIV